MSDTRIILVLTDRQESVMRALDSVERPAPAAAVAEALEPGSDPRGAAQTLRRLRDTFDLVTNGADGWSFTKRGAAKVRRLREAVAA